jgi:DNA-binding CsgD family transcriptional regulator
MMDPEKNALSPRGELEPARDGFQKGVATEEIELLALSAYLSGPNDDYMMTLNRAHRLYVDAGERLRAVRCAFWLGLLLILRGELGRAAGWFARARRLLAREEQDCAEHGYLLLPVALQHLYAHDWDTAYVTAAQAADIGDRFCEPDLTACARYFQGRARTKQGQVSEGLTLLDEVMIAATSGELSPLITGLVYRSVIESCRQIYAFDRVREWTAALTRWCRLRRDMAAFTDFCKVHRMEIMHLCGAWSDVIEEARVCVERSQTAPHRTLAEVLYQQAEAHRLRGEFPAAEEAYRRASQSGLDPQPGLALLRASQGRLDAASVAIRRSLIPVTDPLERTRYLPAYIEILLAEEKISEAREATRELEETALCFGTEGLNAIAASARGAVDLADGDAEPALNSLRHAWRAWRKFDAPYLAARVRVLVALAYDALGNKEACQIELAAARTTFDELGAAPDLARVDSFSCRAVSVEQSVLTRRELQVLRLVAGGHTNKAIAAELVLSEKTVDRHLSNIFAKIGVSSRVAATVFAYEHRLIRSVCIADPGGHGISLRKHKRGRTGIPYP